MEYINLCSIRAEQGQKTLDSKSGSDPIAYNDAVFHGQHFYSCYMFHPVSLHLNWPNTIAAVSQA